MRFVIINKESINEYWPRCRDILEKAFRGKVHADCVDDYYDLLKIGHLQLWIAQADDIVGAAVTVIEQGSKAKICTILSCAGDNLEKWIALLDSNISEFARENDCDAIEYIGRKGFTRFVPEYVEDGRIYVKLLKGE